MRDDLEGPDNVIGRLSKEVDELSSLLEGALNYIPPWGMSQRIHERISEALGRCTRKRPDPRLNPVDTTVRYG
jgi:hypothetical protein